MRNETARETSGRVSGAHLRALALLRMAQQAREFAGTAPETRSVVGCWVCWRRDGEVSAPTVNSSSGRWGRLPARTFRWREAPSQRWPLCHGFVQRHGRDPRDTVGRGPRLMAKGCPLQIANSGAGQWVVRAAGASRRGQRWWSLRSTITSVPGMWWYSSTHAAPGPGGA